ncbi:Biopterin transporter family [Dillenia turbinata]|uniref:Biopterin transporter family n=1 Tax=Dillenia turbinata TaxID=194707 RepID=A0AAN8YRD2_9MAGN
MIEDDEEINVQPNAETEEQTGLRNGFCKFVMAPICWIKMLSDEMHWSFVYGVLVINGVSQGLGGALGRLGKDYYLKDVQKVQPSEAQIYSGVIYIPWIVKPIWGILTDVVPILGFRRRPYLIFSGLLGVISMLLLSLHEMLHLVLAIMALLAGNISVAFADATVDACIAENSITHPFLAPDLQSLCELSLSSGELIGFLISGILVHQIGPQGVFGLLTVPAVLVVSVGIFLDEPHKPDFAYHQVFQNFLDACKALWTTLKCPDIWRPCLYMYLSLAVSVDIYDGMFYWLTDAAGGPSFSQETVGLISSIGSVGAILGALLYQNVLKNHPFRGLFFWSQLLFGLSGMMDLVLVLRINLKFGIPDYLFAVIDRGVSNLVDKLKWLPLLVLSSRICPPGIEGTFFALLMSIQNFGVISSSWGGGLLLHAMGITRTQFHNLWLAILIRNILRVTPLCLLFLVPRGDPDTPAPANDVLDSEEAALVLDDDNVELVSLLAPN